MSIPSFTATASSMISVYIFFFFLVTTSDASFVDKFGANERLSAPRITQSPSNRFAVSSNFAFTTQKPLNLLANYTRRRISKKLELANVIISGNITIHSENNTFQLGFFSPHESSKWYLGIWYSSIPTPTYVWVANRETPITKPASCTLQITETGKLAIMESPNSVIWQSTNNERATDFRFLDNGNLVLLSATGATLWQSFNYPTDTWLPGMNITKEQSLTSWRSLADPSPGLYSLRLNPREYNEIELVHNKSVSYWSTGNWTGAKFARVPEMTIEYIYKFHFANPFTPAASFWYTEIAKDRALSPPLTRFQVDVDGRFKQYTWSPQTENWSKFWSQPDNWCKVDRLCGDLGFCESSSTSPKPCSCLPGFRPVSDYDWEFGDYSGGCVRENGNSCNETDGFMEVGVMEYEGAVLISFSGSISFLREILFGVPEQGTVKKNESKSVLLIVIILGSIAIFVLAIGVLLTLQMRRKSKRRTEDGGFPMLNLKDNEDMRPAMGMVVNMLEGVVEVHSPPAPKLLQALISGESYHGIRIDSGNGISMSALIIHNGVPYLFITIFKWGFAGAAAAYDVPAWGISLAQVVYVVGWSKDGWNDLSWLAFKDIWGFVRLSIASAE
ncbi:hypothetical protein GH714_038724 [Hevea brasiliensis]|uniref:non-specific serine/threonine protein kinase n=1 Tax=Hevea brasiliensis TaxID=3981 RepID=A0A6A6MQI4_HEVBR|nr:hypothetical protein GH714_038724 [Hevea brasiliensis]